MIVDAYGRSFKKLRVSLTHECNYSCLYCSENNSFSITSGKTFQTIKKVLSAEEILQLIENLHTELNLETVRLTGGEPLLYPRIEVIIAGIKKMGIKNIALTTNGHVLFNKIEELKKAGLTSINISLDAIDPETFKIMSRFNGLHHVLNSIEAAISNKIETKINTVVLKQKNDTQVLPLLEFAMKKGIVIRYLELMAMGPLHYNQKEIFFPKKDMLEIISSKYNIKSLDKQTNATAHYWEIGGYKAFGIIANHSTPFCGDCNRLRLDSYGNIYGCLSSLKPIELPRKASAHELKNALSTALSHKQTHFTGNSRTMKSIGG